MLRSLHIENFILIESLNLDFSSGLNVLTGETGAGKSMILDALDALCGGRISTDQIRQGAAQAYLEGVFDIPAVEEVVSLLETEGIELTEQTLTLSRTIQPKGSRCRLNGQLVSLQILRQLGDALRDLLSQHEHQSLLHVERHILQLDRLGDRAHQQTLLTYQTSFRAWGMKKKELQEAENVQSEYERQRDFWQFQSDEIGAVAPEEGEDEALQAERQILLHSENIRSGLQEIYILLQEGQDELPSILSGVGQIATRLRQLCKVAPFLSADYEQLETAQTILQDLAHSAIAHSEALDANPERLAQIDERLDQLNRLKRKYGPTLLDVISFGLKLSLDLQGATQSREKIEQMQREIAELEANLESLSGTLSATRKNLSVRLEQELERELTSLSMAQTRFVIQQESLPVWGERGRDRIEFLISPNPGEPLRPLAKTASGGELSRLILALKIVLRQADPIPTLIFDEIDTGVSGKAARTVADKLHQLSQDFQVLCITHLPPVAAAADRHWHIEKNIKGDRTEVELIELDEAGRLRELAMMASGQASEAALKHAAELIAAFDR